MSPRELDHDSIARLMVHWCHRQSWCHIAAGDVTLGLGRPDVVAVSSPYRPINPEHAAAAAARTAAHAAAEKAYEDEHMRSALAAVEGIHRHEARSTVHEAARDHARAACPMIVPPVHNHLPRARVLVVEVKRNRSDLLGDLKRRKMLSYERHASHCALALHPEALLLSADLTSVDVAAVLAGLGALGLPAHWGVFLARPGLQDWPERAVRSLRGARRVPGAPPPSPGRLWWTTAQIARSLAYRHVKLVDQVVRERQPNEDHDADLG